MKRLPHYSQHFLKNPRFVKELLGHTSIKPSDTVYDIGAGSGVISAALAERCKTVVAVELEPSALAILQKNMERYSNVEIYEGDFLAMSLPQSTYKIFANIPFHVSSPIIHKITEASNPPTDAYLIVQKQFANKLLPDHLGFSSQLGIQIGPWFAITVRKKLQRTDFWPHPNVDTVLIEVKKREEPLIARSELETYYKFITKFFSSPKAFLQLQQPVLNLPATTKPSSLTLSQWLILFQNAKR